MFSEFSLVIHRWSDVSLTHVDLFLFLQRLLHNVLERKRRGQMRQLFEGLKREVGLSHDKTSKISTLKKV